MDAAAAEFTPGFVVDGDGEARELRELAVQEARLAEREKQQQAGQRTLSERVGAVENARAQVRRELEALSAQGVGEAQDVLQGLPRLPLVLGVAERQAALEARHNAIALREAALAETERANAQLEAAISRAQQAFEQAREFARRARPRPSTPPPPVAPPPRVAAPVVAPRKEPNRRVAPRVRLNCEVGLETETNFFSGFAWDISTGGLFVAAFEPMDLGCEVDLAFTLPDGSRVEATATVRWMRDSDATHPGALPGVGLQFTKLDETARAAIERFVGQREPLFYPE